MTEENTPEEESMSNQITRHHGPVRIGSATIALAAAVGVAMGAAAGLSAPALAASWPDKPLTMVVPTRASGGLDRLSRTMAKFLSKELGQPVKVINKPGGMTGLGMKYVLDQPQDGYHIAAVIFPFPIILQSRNMLGLKVSDFAYVNAQQADTATIIVNKDKPYKTIGDLLAAIKANPGKLSHATTRGSIMDLFLADLLTKMGLKADAVRGVNYTSGGPMATAVIGGQVDFFLANTRSYARIKSKTRGLATFDDKADPVWNSPPINAELKKLGYTFKVDFFDTTIRTFAVPASVRTKHPDRWKILVEANRKILSDPANRAAFLKVDAAADWVGPERTAAKIAAMEKALKAGMSKKKKQ